MTSQSTKRSRKEFELPDDDDDHSEFETEQTVAKKPRLMENAVNNISNTNAVISRISGQKYPTIEMHACNITFTATQPVKNTSSVRKWEAKLNHDCMDKMSILVKASFSVCNINKLSHCTDLDLPGLSDVLDTEEFFYEMLYVEKVEVMPDFGGFGYGLCLVQRIIDNHARHVDLTVVKPHSLQCETKQNEPAENVIKIWESMGFEQMENSVYWSRAESQRHPRMKDFCKCFQVSSTNQKITESIFSRYQNRSETSDYHDQKSSNDENKTNSTVDIDSCFITFESEQNATNDILEEDFISGWSAELKCRTPEQEIVVLATASFWLINLPRLIGKGWYDRIFTVFDAPCQELSDLFCSVINTDWLDGTFKLHEDDKKSNLRVRLKKELAQDSELNIDTLMELMPFYSDEMNEGGGGNIVYLDRIKVNKQYAGFGYGRCLTQGIIDNHARGFDGVVLKPFPLQWEEKDMTTEQNKKLFELDMKKVIDVWESMWFYQFGGPDSAYFGRSEAWTHPKPEEFCKCLQQANPKD